MQQLRRGTLGHVNMMFRMRQLMLTHIFFLRAIVRDIFIYYIIIQNYDCDCTILGHPLWDRQSRAESSWGPSWSDGFCFLFEQTILLLYKIQFSKVDLIPPHRPSPKDTQQEQRAWGQNPSAGIATNYARTLLWSTMAATSLLIAFGDQETLPRENSKTSIVITAKAPHTGMPGGCSP